MSSASSSLTDALRGVLLDPEEATALPVHGRTEAAVLVALYLDGGELHTVFTRRRDDLRSHPGEISFPGGRRDEGETLKLTALRETEEEIGLAREEVAAARRPDARSDHRHELRRLPVRRAHRGGQHVDAVGEEVDEVLELRLADVRAARTRRRLQHRGIPFRTDVYDVGEQLVIWGATARIVSDLLARIEPVLDG